MRVRSVFVKPQRHNWKVIEMSNVVQKTKLLIVDTSPSMAQVLKTFADLHDYDADVFSDSVEACAALANRFSSFAPGVGNSGGYDCVVLGWPKEQIKIIADLLGALGSVDNSDLPLIVLSEELDQDVQTLARRRAKTRTLLWRDHNRIEEIVEEMVVREAAAVVSPVSSQLQAGTHQIPNKGHRSKRLLLVDDTPSVCLALRDTLENNGYRVTLVNSAAEARGAVAKKHFDLLLTEFFLQEESGEDLCRYINSLNSAIRPVCVLMTRKILDSVVQRSLAVGAISCLDKSESTETLFARLDAIAHRLLPNVESARIAQINNEGAHGAVSGVTRLMQMSVAPTVLLNDKRIIIAANAEAARLLAAGDEKALPSRSFEKAIHGAPVKRSSDQPVKALFRNLAGASISVVYRSRDISSAEVGLDGDVCMLTFESVDENKATEPAALAGASVSAATPRIAEGLSPEAKLLVSKEKLRVSNIENAPGKIAPGESISPVTVLINAQRMERNIENALTSVDDHTTSLLVIDIKMVAAITGDRLSLGQSEPLLELVRTELARQYTRDESLAYLDDGKFALLFESDNAEQAFALAEKLVALVPKLIDGLSDIELLSHAAFIELPRRSDISARYILKHCAAACLKTEIEGLDNQIFDINANEKLPPKRTDKPLDVAAAVGVDVFGERAEETDNRSVATI